MTKKFLTVFEKFVKIESLSGILLFSATVVAMVWANSAFSDSYATLWDTKLGFGSDSFGLKKPLILWVNDGLMAIFFFLIGLEIKRELLIGELNTIRKATFPFFAALGGMFVPLGLFLLLNDNPDTVNGWGIPMATDIAFTLAILKVLGKSIPLSIKIFLTAFAIVDDLGAVLVIAIFYTGGIDWVLLGYALALLAVLFFLSYKSFYSKYVTILVGLVIWTLFLKSGIHPTIAGVLLAFTIPIRQKINASTFVQELSDIEDEIENDGSSDQKTLTKNQIEQLDNMEDLIDKFQSPVQIIEHKLHGWVAYVIMPIFALANAGIVFNSDVQLETGLIINLALALFVGKLVGIPIFSYLALKLNVAELPEGTNFMQIIGVSILAGVGFTMSIFVANLAFTDNAMFLDSAKVGIIIGSVISGIIGAIVLKMASKKKSEV